MTIHVVAPTLSTGVASKSARVRSSVDQMIGAARAAGVEPILATELTLTHPNTWSDSFTSTIGWLLGKSSYPDQINGHVIGLNRWIAERARQESLLLLDLHPVVSETGGGRQRAYATPDGSHVPPAGYAAISGYAQPLLAARLGTPGS